MAAERLKEYKAKRDFQKTKEPLGGRRTRSKNLQFVIQEHHASRLHYDFRLEWNGVLKSWAVPKGPSLDPKVKRLAVEVEDHPIEYGKFEGTIPKGEYGAGEVYIWDSGQWLPHGDPKKSLKKGHLDFELEGHRLRGGWTLVRTKMKASGDKSNWLLIKKADESARQGKASEVQPIQRRRSARKSSFPSFIKPQLATLVNEPPEGPDWLHEVKFDGYRILAALRNGEVQLWTRNGNDWTTKYPSVVKGLEKLKVDDALLDGEVVWLDDAGRPDFQGLQNAMKAKRSGRLFYYVFDLLEINGEDLKTRPQRDRKAQLERILPKKTGVLRYSEHFEENPKALLEKMCDMHLEGVISKNVEASYRSGRGRNWLKTKCGHAQEFVVGGFSKAKGSRSHFGALYLGVYENKKLAYVGKVGTGFNEETLKSLYGRLAKLQTAKSPFVNPPRERDATWVKPELVAEIRFSEWTKDGHLRVPVFHGLRADKPAREIVREEPNGASLGISVEDDVMGTDVTRDDVKSRKSKPPEDLGSFQISHPDKIYYQKEKLTKLDVANYYFSVAPLMLEHLSGRPVSIIRCPEGSRKTCFLQKHLQGKTDPSIQLFSMDEQDGEFFSVNSAKGLLALVQRGSLEIHVCNARRPELDFADQIVFDLDPDPSVSWKEVRSGAHALKGILDALKLTSFIKLTGGKGVHIHVPIEPKYDWDEIKAFAQSVATKMTVDNPNKFIDKSSKKARHGRIFVDYLRNSRMATAVCAYSLRAREYSSVAMPILWSELENIERADQFSMIEGLKKIASRKKDPWAGYLETSNSLNQRRFSLEGIKHPKR